MYLLQMSGLKWQPEYMHDPRKMPLSRLPVLKEGDQLIPLSAHIQMHLEAKGVDFNAGLSDLEKAQAHALVQMTEAGLYNIPVHDRWLVDNSWKHTRAEFFKAIPWHIRGPLTRKLRKGIRAKMMAQGTAQFSESERVKSDLVALSAQLGKSTFLFGEAPSAADATIAPVLDMILNLPVETAARSLLRSWDGLPAYVVRVSDAIYPVAQPVKLSVAA